MKRTVWVSITLGLAALLMLPISGPAAPLSEKISKKRVQVEKEKKKERVLTTDIQGYSNRIDSLRGEIRALESRQTKAQSELDRKRSELKQVRNRLDRSRDRLARLQVELLKAEDALSLRLVELYKSNEPNALTVVLQSDGFADLLERTEFLERVSRQDREIVIRVTGLKERVARQVGELKGLERRARDAANTILARRNEIAGSKRRVDGKRDELAQVRKGRRATLGKVQGQRTKLEEDLAALERANARVQGQLQGVGENAFRGAGPIKRGSGRLIWPVNGPVTSPFGMRWGRLHAGIDIGVPTGTPIRAADSGRVVLLGWTGGYGNYTCVQHTGSLSTCYAHQSRYATSNGASVSQGQVIGYVGCTGNCFGDHLHFEVRVGGAPVNPLGYL